MRFVFLAATAAALFSAQGASAAVTLFNVKGKVLGSSYGSAAAADIYSAAPVGSAYIFSFSYDPSTAPTYGSPTYGAYVGLPVNAAFTLGSTTFAIPSAGFATGNGPYTGVHFSTFGNAPFSSSRIMGYQLLDFSLTLQDPSGTALPGGSLPSQLDVSRFSTRSFDSRFAFGANGETRLNFSVDSITSGVPEPTTWMIMMLGFGLVGGTIRRARATKDGRGRVAESDALPA